MKISKFKIPKLPRKLKKKIYGKRGKRHHLCLSIMESKKFKKLLIEVNYNKSFDEILNLFPPNLENQNFTWNLKSNVNENN